jgi:predicted ATPase
MATEPSNETVAAVDERTKPPFLRRVRIRGYKSIAFCDVTLAPLTVLVGRNASGKSNFLDALAFLRDSMVISVPEAVKRRGGWASVVCQTSPTQKIEIEVEVKFICGPPNPRVNRNGLSASVLQDVPPLPDLTGVTFTANYRLECAAEPLSAPTISRESLEIADETHRLNTGFEAEGGIITRERSLPDSPEPLRLPHSWKLLSVSRPDQPLLRMLGMQPFIDLGDGLRWMGFYNFHPDAMRILQRPGPGWLLEKDGWNLASVVEATQKNDKEAIERVGRFLTAITETVEFVRVNRLGEYETVRFRVPRGGGDYQEFDAVSMSDGTLRAFAALVAAFQIVLPDGHPSLIAIEEPETSLHPAATRALVDALDEATLRTQILLTTQSAEILDNPTIRPENVRVVQMIDGQTVIAPVDEASVEIVRQKLDTLGGLERQNQLEPDLDDRERQRRLSRNGPEPQG